MACLEQEVGGGALFSTGRKLVLEILEMASKSGAGPALQGSGNRRQRKTDPIFYVYYFRASTFIQGAIPQQRAAPSYVPSYSSRIMVPSITQLLLKKVGTFFGLGTQLKCMKYVYFWFRIPSYFKTS